MGVYRTALLVAVSHSNLENRSQNHTWTTLTSGVASNQDYYSSGNYYNYTTFKDRGLKTDLYEFHGNVNILLGGAMLIVISTIVCLICYCCHRKTKMRSSLYMQHHRWFDSDYNMEVYSVEQYYDMTMSQNEDDFDAFTALRNINERPPSYECIMALNEAIGGNQKVPPVIRTDESDAGTQTVADEQAKSVDINGNIAHYSIEYDFADRLNNNNNNDNNEQPTTSSNNASYAALPAANAATTTTRANEEMNGNDGEWDMSRANGIVRFDMSKIMDHTGLPTYEAALTLKSSNYI